MQRKDKEYFAIFWIQLEAGGPGDSAGSVYSAQHTFSEK